MALSKTDLEQISNIVQLLLKEHNLEVIENIDRSNDKLFERLLHILREFPTTDELQDLLNDSHK